MQRAAAFCEKNENGLKRNVLCPCLIGFLHWTQRRRLAKRCREFANV